MKKNEIVNLLYDNKKNNEIYKWADKVRQDNVGTEIHLRALIEFSNICRCHCKYCGIRNENTNIARYRLEENEILSLATNAANIGYKTIVLQSGEDSYFSADRLCSIIKKIKKLDVAITLSIGERSFDEYKEFKKAGANRYLLRIETTDKDLYKMMHPYSNFNNRLKCLDNLKKLGFEVGTGCIVGLPKQSIESLADDILFFKEIDADMIGIGPFIPHEQTPLKNSQQGDFWLALKVMALTRINLPNINIPATTAMETIYPNGRIIALQSGANVVMPNVTNLEYRKKYEIYPGKSSLNEDIRQYKSDLETKINEVGRVISTGYGFRIKK